MKQISIYADFNNADTSGRLRLNCDGTFRDLGEQNVELREGMSLLVYDDELEADGTAHFSTEEQIWVVTIDWKAIRQKHA